MPEHPNPVYSGMSGKELIVAGKYNYKNKFILHTKGMSKRKNLQNTNLQSEKTEDHIPL